MWTTLALIVIAYLVGWLAHPYVNEFVVWVWDKVVSKFRGS